MTITTILTREQIMPFTKEGNRCNPFIETLNSMADMALAYLDFQDQLKEAENDRRL